MRLGVGYNVFDGEEWLEHSIKSIRDYADYIVVVYSIVSNNGQVIKTGLEPLISSLIERGLINSAIKVDPQHPVALHVQESTKRNIGLNACRRKQCTHFLSMDVDELYRGDQFLNAKNILEREEWDSSVCQMVTYFKEPTLRLEPKETYYVPFIFKITADKFFDRSCAFPYLVDPTRKFITQGCKPFLRDTLEMHHFSHVRKDMRTKLACSSASESIKIDIDAYVQYFDNWKFGDPVLSAFRPHEKPSTAIRTANIFGVTL